MVQVSPQVGRWWLVAAGMRRKGIQNIFRLSDFRNNAHPGCHHHFFCRPTWRGPYQVLVSFWNTRDGLGPIWCICAFLTKPKISKNRGRQNAFDVWLIRCGAFLLWRTAPERAGPRCHDIAISALVHGSKGGISLTNKIPNERPELMRLLKMGPFFLFYAIECCRWLFSCCHEILIWYCFCTSAARPSCTPARAGPKQQQNFHALSSGEVSALKQGARTILSPIWASIRRVKSNKQSGMITINHWVRNGATCTFYAVILKVM